jgi:hypothetical protein
MKTAPSAAAKLIGFSVAIAVVFGASFGIARAVDRDGLAGRSSGGHDEMEAGEGHDAAAVTVTPGLAVAQSGFRLVADATSLPAGPAVPFGFHIEGPDGRPVTRFDQLHERELHLIVVRRDMTGYEHVHPTRTADGRWSAQLDLREGGTWRAFADFAPTGQKDQLTLGVDLQVPGSFVPGTGPTSAKPADPALDVSIDRKGDEIEVTVRRNGTPIRPDPYLGARGHLVALRGGDLAYLHVHPLGGSGPSVRFHAEMPTSGTYALFFDYQVDGVVHTATGTAEVRHGPGH